MRLACSRLEKLLDLNFEVPRGGVNACLRLRRVGLVQERICELERVSGGITARSQPADRNFFACIPEITVVEQNVN
jgi:hypothetical protein